MAFEKVSDRPDNGATPAEFLTKQEREMRSQSEEFEATADQFVDESASDYESQDALPAAKSQPEVHIDVPEQTTEEKIADQEEKAKRDIEQRLQEIRDKRREELLAQPEIRRYRDDFILELSGLQPFTQQYEIGPYVRVTFVSPNAEELDEIQRQTAIDFNARRWTAPQEQQMVMSNYKMAAAILEFQVVDPETSEARVHYVKDSTPVDFTSDQMTRLDYPIRKSWLFMSTRLMATGTLLLQVAEYFNRFQNLINGFVDLLELEPSFFTNAYSLDGETD